MSHPDTVQVREIAPLALRHGLACGLLVLATYTIVLLVARDGGLWTTLLGALANTIPIVLLGLVARGLILRRLVGRSRKRVIAGHVLLALAFMALSYWSLLVLLGLINGVSATEFDVRPFNPRAMAWQSLQNLTLYGLIAALSHLQARPKASEIEAARRTDPRESPGRYFVRIGDNFLPIDLSEVVSIIGADDYAEVRSLTGRHLVRMTLAEFEAALDPVRFVRVHRSSIVNLDRIERAEPAGNGRILLHLEDGDAIQTSRAGAKLVRGRII